MHNFVSVKTVMLTSVVSLLMACTAVTEETRKVADSNPLPSPCNNALRSRLPDGLYQAFGQGANQVQAIDQALSTIARQLRVAIRAEASSTQTKIDGKVSEDFTKTVASLSEQVFDDYQLRCADPVTASVVVEYDNRSLPVRLKSRLRDWWGSQGWHLVWASGLQVDAKLSAVAEQSGIAPESIGVSVQRDRNRWYLQLNERRVSLRDQEWRLFYALPPAQREERSFGVLDTNNMPLAHSMSPGEEFRFTLNIPPEYSYLSVLALDVSGKIVVVRSNTPIHGGKLVIPDPPGVFSAELPAGTVESVDDYIVLLSEGIQILPESFWYFDGWQLLENHYDSLGLRVVVR
ncbi:hypothetical protein [Zhongshania sp.]|uniref:hypothetical protein n=1 Tax=Zhongshania sp. TaxID=1971902 RepID=UPI0035633E02